jgi:hypothetical protein
MSGTMIDLMPEAIRRRAMAGQRLRRLIAIGICTMGILVAFATHSQLRSDRLEEAFIVAESRATQALQLERQADDMSLVRIEIESAMESYDRVAMPIRMDSLMNRIVMALPRSTTLEQLLLEYEDDSGRRTGDLEKGVFARRIIGGISGFAASDDDVAALVQQLTEQDPFEDVRLEFTRSRDVRGVSARAFQLTFTIDLHGSWEVGVSDLASAAGGDS